MPDTAGNSLATATALNLTSTVQSFPDLVTPTANDYYRFALPIRSGLNLSLTGLDADANVELLDSAGNPLSIDGVPQRSANVGTFSESINTALDPGIYYIRVFPSATTSLANYTLNVSAQENLLSTDILWYNSGIGAISVWQLDGTNYVSSEAVAQSLINWTVGGLGDFNQDGNSDIIWRSDALGLTSIWFMNGSELLSFTPLTPALGAGTGWVPDGTGDFNDDGNVDIIWRNEGLATTSVWFMDGSTFLSATAITPSVGAGWTIGGTGDFNGDGNVDLLWRNRSAAVTAVWLMNGTQFLSAVPITPVVGSSWTIGGTGDFNRDGKVDILWHDTNSGTVALWLMNGTTFSSAVALSPLLPGESWVANAPYNSYGEPLSIDVAGNNLATAFDLGKNLTGSATYRERVDGATDTDDFFQFNVSSTSRVSLGLANLSANLDLQLLDSTGGLIQSSTLGNLSSEAIVSTLSAGTYFVRAFPNSAGDRSTYSLSISVNNLPILATNLPLSVSEQGSASISSSLLRVTDADNTPFQLIYTVGNLPTNGSLSINGAVAIVGTTFTQADLNDGTRIAYIHNGSETTSDRFTFTVADSAGGAISVNTFSIAVAPVNDAPVLQTNLGLTLSEGQESSITTVQLQVTDPDSPAQSLTYAVTTLPANGTLLLSGTAVTSFTQADLISGNLSYRHNGSESLSDSFFFTITDGVIPAPIGPNSFSISVLPVNDPPVVNSNIGLTLSEGTTAVITQGRLQATDPDGPGSVTYTLNSIPTNGVLRRGAQTLSIGQTFTQTDIADNQLSYVHNGGETTTDSFQFTVVDGLGAIAQPATFSISVLPVNDAPVLTVPSGQTIDQDTNTLIPGIRVTDADVGTGEVTVTLSTGGGTLTLGRNTGINFITGDGVDDATVSFRGGLDVTNFVLQSLQYRSSANFQGADTISVTVSDGGNFGLGGALSDSDVITLTVAPVNDAPVITVPGAQTVREDTTSPISGISIGDPDAGTSLLRVSLAIVNGTVSLNSTSGVTITTGTGNRDKNLIFEGSLGAINSVLGGLTYLSDRDFNGSDSLTISVSDTLGGANGIPLSDTETIAITVTPVNDAPILAVPGAQTVNENTDLRITGISVNDVDATGDLTVNLSVSSGRLSLNSTAGLTFDEGDGTGDGTLVFRGAQAVVNTALRTLIYRANTDFNGADTIAINVSDGGSTGFGGVLGDAETIAVNVLGINNAPVIAIPTTPPTVDSDTNLTIAGISIADPDAGGGTLSVSLLAANGILSLASTAGLTFTQGDGSQDNRLSFSGTLFAINAALGNLTYRSYPGFTNGFDRISVSVNDNGNSGLGVNLSDTKVLLVNVGGAVNRLPVATNDSFSVAEEGTLSAASILANDSDPDFTLPLTAQLVAAPTNALSFTLNPNGTFTYSPAANFSGNDSFTYRAIDVLGGGSNTATVVINVSSSNDLPTAAGDNFTLAEDQTFSTGNVLTNDTDIDNNLPLSAQLIAAPTNATNFSFSPNGSFTYTPRANFSGGDRFTYAAVDALGGVSSPATVSLTITAVNDAPTASNDSFTVNAGGTLNLTAPGVLANDTDVDTPLSSLSATVVTAPTNGSLTLNPNGSFTYRPTGSFTGADSFTYQASDGSLTSNLATVTISVSSNNAPTAVGDSFTLPEDSSLTLGNVLTNDSDPEVNLPLTATLNTAPPNALSFTLNPDGTFSYQPRANFNGTDSFVYRAIDSLGGISNPTTVSLSVTPVNDAPIANNDTLSVTAGSSLVLTAPGILANDTDIDSASLTVLSVSSTASGSLTLNPNGSFTYTPNAGFNGTDSFTYRASDGSLTSNLAIVSLIVSAAPNILPTAVSDSFTTSEDPTVSLSGNVLVNDTDPDGNLPLTASVATAPTNALSFTLNANGSFNYTPTANFNGVDSFTYVARDSLGAASSPATVTLSVTAVNDAPTVGNDSFTVANTSSLNITAPGILANDTDVDSSTLTATLINNATGTLSLNPNGSFTYRPIAGFTGVDSFTYRASDGSLDSTLGTVSITVSTVVNNLPTANPDSFSTSEDPTVSLTGNVLANDTDPDNNLPLTASIVAAPGNALSFTLNSDGSFSYLPTANFNGNDSFTYVAVDSLGGRSNTATVSFSVTAVSDAPIAGNNTYNVTPTSSLNITAPGVLIDDTDPDGGTLSATLLVAPTATAFTLRTDGSFTYTPNAGFSGNDSFTYQAGNGTTVSNTATVIVSVSANAFPTAVADSFTTSEDTTVTLAGNVLTNDTDPDNNLPLTASVIAAPSSALSFTLNSDGSFTYLPIANFSGGDSFTYVATDSLGGRSNTATVSLSVTPVNDLPTASNNTVSVNAGSTLTIAAPGILANDTDPENGALTASLITTTGQGTLSLNGDGSFVYTPNVGASGTDSFTYVANDGTGNSNTATVSIQINRPPTAIADVYTAAIGGTLNVAPIQGVLANDTDPDGGALSATVLTTPTQGVLTLNPNGSFTYAPNAGATGVDTFTYQASDGLASSTATVTLSLRTNAAPIAANDSYRAVTDGTLSVSNIDSVLQNDSDPDAGTALSATLNTQASRGSVTLNPDGSFVYIPQAGFQGADSFTYRASDGITVSGLATVTLSVAPNTAPIARNDSYTAFTGISRTVNQVESLLVNDTDADGTPLTVSLVSGPQGTLSLNSDGSFVYTSGATFQGVDTFVYRASDGLVSATATASISVILNSPPTAQPDVFGAIAGQTLVVTAPGVLVNDNDPEGTLFARSGGVLPRNGQLLNFSDTGAFTYLPNSGFIGADSFTYLASDGVSESTPVTVTISVANNAPPTAVGDRYSVNRNSSLVVPRTLGVLANDSDPNVGQPLSATVVTGTAQGSLSLNPDGSFAYTPRTTASGTDSFTYRANDGSLNSTAVVTITINTASAPPTANNDGGFTVAANGTLSITAAGVLANDTDPDGDPIQASLVGNAANGTVTLNPNGSFVYRPNSSFTSGTDSFTYQATDGLNSSTPATVFVTVGGANAAPVVSAPGGQLIGQNTALTLTGLSVADPDVGSSPLQITLSATNGVLTLSGIGGLTFSTGDGVADPTMTFTGTQTAINAALNGLQFASTTGYSGTAQITLAANDQGATGTGGAQTGSGTVSVNVASSATIVSNINPGSFDSNPANLVASGNTVYFSASDGFSGTELWRSDGTAATTTRVADINTGSGGSSPANLTIVGNTLYYSASTPATGTELWRTDLTAGTGATLVRDIRSGIQSSLIRNLLNFNGTLFFEATDGTGLGLSLFRSDGTGANTVRVGSGYSNINNLTVVGNTLFFTASGGTQLWRSDGTDAGTVLVRNVGSGAGITNLRAVGNTLFFTATDAGGNELWRSDGTGANTSRVADLNPGATGSSPTNLVAFNGNLYFFANSGSGFSLFQSTPTGTISPIAALPSAGASPAQLTIVNNRLFFVVDNGTAANPSLQLWSSDGATATLVQDLNAGNDEVSALTNFNGTLFFVANDGTGYKVFRSNGTSGGTSAVSGSYTIPPTNLTPAGSRLLFTATDAINGSELWAIG